MPPRNGRQALEDVYAIAVELRASAVKIGERFEALVLDTSKIGGQVNEIFHRLERTDLEAMSTRIALLEAAKNNQTWALRAVIVALLGVVGQMLYEMVNK
mgnify:CR=1 FL=1